MERFTLTAGIVGIVGFEASILFGPEARVTEDIRLPPTERWIFFFFKLKIDGKKKFYLKTNYEIPLSLKKNENF